MTLAVELLAVTGDPGPGVAEEWEGEEAGRERAVVVLTPRALAVRGGL